MHIESGNKLLRTAFGYRTEEMAGRWGKLIGRDS